MIQGHELLKKGGKWLAAARFFIQCNTAVGSWVPWGSNESVTLPMVKIEKMAADIAAAAINELALPYLVYCPNSNTIRQMPQNYLIAQKDVVEAVNGWICHPDMAADRILCNRVFNALFDYDCRYQPGEYLIQKINYNKI